METKKLEQILSKSYSFLIQTLICMIISDDVIHLTSKDVFIIGLEEPKGLPSGYTFREMCGFLAHIFHKWCGRKK